MQMKINFNNKKQSLTTILVGFLVLAFLISLLCYVATKKGTRRSFVFPSVDTGDYIVETRNVPKIPGKDSITAYVEEILLGSSVERTKSIFTSGTRLISCFEEDKVLYVNLSDKALDQGLNVIDIYDGAELLKRNIQQNFKRLKSVEIYVDGHSISAEK